jgi:hypothetical protein
MEIKRGNENLQNLAFPVCSNMYHVLPYHTNHIDGTLFTCLVKVFQAKILESSNVSATLRSGT